MSSHETESYIRLNLTAFINSMVKDVEDEEGNIKKCVVIPMDDNNLRESDSKRVFAHFGVCRLKKPSVYGYTHYVRFTLPSVIVDKLIESGRQVPIAGNMKGWQSKYDKFQNSGKSVKVKDYE